MGSQVSFIKKKNEWHKHIAQTEQTEQMYHEFVNGKGKKKWERWLRGGELHSFLMGSSQRLHNGRRGSKMEKKKAT